MGVHFVLEPAVLALLLAQILKVPLHFMKMPKIGFKKILVGLEDGKFTCSTSSCIGEYNYYSRRSQFNFIYNKYCLGWCC